MTDDTERGGPTGRARTSRLQGDVSLDVRSLEEGAVVRLAGDARGEVVHNPRDGMWILVRYLDVPEEPDLVNTEELVFWADILEVGDG